MDEYWEAYLYPLSFQLFK